MPPIVYVDHRGAGWVWPGVSVTDASGACLPFAELAARLALAQAYGAPGIAVFSAGGVNICAYWDEFAALP